MPYPIPDNLDDIEGWRWYLVPLPDSDPMIRIAWGMWSELTNYWMWGEEGPVPDDSDKAAQLWSEALYEAWRVRDMGFPDAILGYIDEVETLLRALQNLQGAGAACCENLSATGENAETDLIPGGDPPNTWGDGEVVADASDWEQLVCGAAHAYVDHLKDMADQLNTIVGASAIAVGAIAAILGLLSGAGIILNVSYGSAAAVVAALISGATNATFGDTATELEAARDSIVCQMFGGSGASLADEVQSAIGSTAWTLFFQYVDYGSARNVMLEGSHGAEYLGVNRRTDCGCEGNIYAYVYNGDGSTTQRSARTLTITSHQWDTGYQRAQIAFRDHNADLINVRVTSFTVSHVLVHDTSSGAYQRYNAAGTQTYNNDSPWTPPQTDATFTFLDSRNGATTGVAFELELTWEPV